MGSAPLLDFIASAKARDEGMQRVLDNNQDWFALAMIQLGQFARTRDGYANTEYGITGEDVRVALLPHVGKPQSPHAWGALINKAVRDGILVATGQYRAMKDKRSHARKTAVYMMVSK